MNQNELISYFKLLGIEPSSYNKQIYSLHNNKVKVHIGVSVKVYASWGQQHLSTKLNYPITIEQLVAAINKVLDGKIYY